MLAIKRPSKRAMMATLAEEGREARDAIVIMFKVIVVEHKGAKDSGQTWCRESELTNIAKLISQSLHLTIQCLADQHMIVYKYV